MSNRERLERFYAFYAPDKLPSVDAALEAYQGREDQMFRALERKYGPESAVTGSNAANSARPAEGDHDSQAVVPTLNFSPFRQRLIRFYRKWQPDKLNTVDQVLTAYAGREPLLFQALVKKYGPEPEVDEAAAEQSANDNLAETVGDLNLSTGELKEEVKTPKSPTGAYKQALLSVGYASSDFQGLFQAYGKGKEKYAGAIALIMKVIGDESLFDVNNEKLQFPADRYPKAKDEWDELAFDHILAYRQIFFAAYGNYVATRDEEGRERQAIAEELAEAKRRDAYECLVRRQALLLIEPIEEERRSIITDEERLRFNGLCTWFRQKRSDYLLTEEEDEEILQLASRWDRFKEDAAGAVGAAPQKLHTIRSKSASKTAEWQRLATNSSPDPDRPWRVPRVASDRAVKPVQHEQPWRPNGVAPRSTSQAQSAQDPEHRTASVHSRTTSHVSSRQAVMKKLQDKPLESVRAKSIVQKGLFSQLKYGGQPKRLALGATW